MHSLQTQKVSESAGHLFTVTYDMLINTIHNTDIHCVCVCVVPVCLKALIQVENLALYIDHCASGRPLLLAQWLQSHEAPQTQWRYSFNVITPPLHRE